MSTGVLSLYGHEHCLWHYTGENMDTVLVAETGENMANIYSSVLEIKILVCGQDSPLVADSKENIGLGFQARC
jgi:hypothetical protein